MAGGGGFRHTHAIMNDLFLPNLLLTLPADSGTLVIALFFSALAAAFTFRMERTRDK